MHGDGLVMAMGWDEMGMVRDTLNTGEFNYGRKGDLS